MAKKANARRYAQAVFELALEKKELEKWQSDLKKMVAAVEHTDFLAALESPRLKFEDKDKLLSAVLRGIGPLALNLARLLVTRGSIAIIGEIAEEYGRLLNGYHGIEPAEVTTAVPLDEPAMQHLTKNLGAIIGKKVVVKPAVDREIIGGMVARVGGKLLDGSTRSRLAALRRELVGGEVKR